MEKISSFTVDHILLQPGVYVSRKDRVGKETVTTFDLRFTSPNQEPNRRNFDSMVRNGQVPDANM